MPTNERFRFDRNLCDSLPVRPNSLAAGSDMSLYTFGYEGLAIKDFIARLLAKDVQQVIDVRELPLSRKPGFSKNALAAALAEAGIVYRHMAAFGCPRPIRNRYKADGDWAAYARGFRRYLADQDEAIDELVQLADEATICLVCFEADFNRCHRSLIAEAARASGGPRALHITATGVVADADGRRAA